MKTYKSIFALSLVIAVLVSIVAFPARARAEQPITTNEQFPIDYRVGNVCSNDPNEIIQLDGTLHVTSTQVADPNGGLHLTSHANWQGVEGTNLTTGEKYRFVTRGKITFSTNGELPFTSTSTTHNNLVGQGSGAILVMQIVFKITMNANGEITTHISHQSAECKE